MDMVPIFAFTGEHIFYFLKSNFSVFGLEIMIYNNVGSVIRGNKAGTNSGKNDS